MKQNLLFALIYFFIFNSCGFKVDNFQQNFSISEINSTGDARINYKIKNKLLSYNKSTSQNLIIININSNKSKSIKEKNINNEVTKYELILNSTIDYKALNSNLEGSFSLSKKGDYGVSTKYSDTLTKEKKLLSLLVNELSVAIQETMANIFNDS